MSLILVDDDEYDDYDVMVMAMMDDTNVIRANTLFKHVNDTEGRHVWFLKMMIMLRMMMVMMMVMMMLRFRSESYR